VLLLIQFRRVIDVNRCRCWRALQRVLAGHCGYAAVARLPLQRKFGCTKDC
jgi:hypothetical protein